MTIHSVRIAARVDLGAMFIGRRDEGPARLILECDEPDTGRRCPPGYATISLEGADSAVFMLSSLRRALDEYERVEETP